ncbi:MAG: UxaA family hydrolase, partial [Mucilaginibacter sp.]
MRKNVLKVHPADNVLVALTDLQAGQDVVYEGNNYQPIEFIPAKHKFATTPILQNQDVKMYGVLVGTAKNDIPAGGLLTTANVKHAANAFTTQSKQLDWTKPNITQWQQKTFNGYHRPNGEVGTANYWLVIPMVFCENRNVEVLQEALLKPLGYARQNAHELKVQKLIDQIKAGHDVNEALFVETESNNNNQERVFPNVDGIKFLTHTGGCGGIRQDSEALCGLLAGYITHPNVAGAT